MFESLPRLLLVSVGNTRTKRALLSDGELSPGKAVLNEELAGGVDALLEELAGDAGTGVVIASVNRPVADRIETELRRRADADADGALGDIYRLGVDLAIDIRHTLDDDSTVGQDRLLNAMGAFAVMKQACVVADLGTATTVDFVDGEGTFHGGVIAPGAGMMLRALHEQTAALPMLAFEPPDADRGPFGKDTRHAMMLGVRNAVAGLLRVSVESYAERYGGFPLVIATGGDAQRLLGGEEIVDRIVPDLQLVGLAEACRRAMGDEGEAD